MGHCAGAAYVDRQIAEQLQHDGHDASVLNAGHDGWEEHGHDSADHRKYLVKKLIERGDTITAQSIARLQLDADRFFE